MKRKLNYALLLVVISSIVLALACKKDTPKNYYLKYTYRGNTVTLKDTTQFGAVSSAGKLYIVAGNGIDGINFYTEGTNNGVGNYQFGVDPSIISPHLVTFINGPLSNSLNFYYSFSGNMQITNISNGDITGSFNTQMVKYTDPTQEDSLAVEFYAPYYQE